MATPVPELVEEIADRVAVIANGVIAAFETVEQLRARTGCSNLADAYEQLASPQTLAKIDRYFQGGVI